MIDIHSLEVIGRKELQALAKEHGIKANQKSALLRDQLRAVLVNDVSDQTEGPINANEENLPDVTAENTLAKEPGRDSEEVNVDEREMEDFSPNEAREENATDIMQLKYAPAEESPSGSEIANIAYDGIGISSPDNTSEENVHNDTVPSGHRISTGEIDSSIEVKIVDDKAWEKPVDEKDQEYESPSSSDVANIADGRIELSFPENANEENAHNDACQSEHNVSTEETASSIEVVNVDDQEWEKPRDEKDLVNKSPSSSDVANVTDDRNDLSSPENAREENEHNDTAHGEHNKLAGKTASSIEAANIVEQAREKPVEERDQEEDSPNSDVANVADGRIELSSLDNTSKENAHNDTVQSEHSVSTEETASGIEVANVDDQAWGKSVDEKDKEDESPSSSDVANVADNKIDLSTPDNASEENAHNDTAQGEQNMSTRETASISEVANINEQAWEKLVEERDQEEDSPNTSDAANVADDRISLSSPDNESEENVHNTTVQSEQNVSTEEAASSIELANVEAWGKSVVEKDQEDESPSSSHVANVADNKIDLSSPDNASEENAHNGTVQSEDSMPAVVPASSRDEANIDDQAMENPAKEKEIDGYGEIMQSEHVPCEKSPNVVISSPSVEVEVFPNESGSILEQTHVSFSEATKFVLVDEANNGHEKDVTLSNLSEEMIVASAEKEVAADCHKPKESHSVDGDSENDTNRSGITDAAGSTFATIGRQHEERAVQMKAKSSGPTFKIVSKYSRKRPLSKGEQMSFGFRRKETKPLPSMSAITSSQALTQKIVPKKAKASLPAWKIAAEDFRKRPALSGNKVMAMKESKPRTQLQTLSNYPQQDNPKSFKGKAKRPVQMSMPERNQKQLQKFFDRQAAAREERAKKAVPPEFHRA